MRYYELKETISTDSEAFRRWFNGSKVVDERGNPLPVYHGTGRPDRVGAIFRKSRATAGPMAYFTNSPEIASGYASSKPDTSISDTNYPLWFKVKIGRSKTNIVNIWYFLSSEKKTQFYD
jgi:hypothetical protein